MKLENILSYFETSPTIRLLRAHQAPFILGFLYHRFKQTETIAIQQSDLLGDLANFLDDLREPYPDILRDKPENYLTEWSSGQQRWLHRFYETGKSEPTYQLTPHTEDAIAFIEQAVQQDLDFVGTESRLRLVINTLEALIVGASDKPEVHLEHLQKEKRRIENEIKSITSEGKVNPYQPTKIREQFATAVSLLRQLQGDFRSVEENFKQITHEVQTRQVQGNDTRGGILADALDAEDELKQQDQGISFQEFLRFIHSPPQQERLREIIRHITKIPELTEQIEGLETVRRMVPVLLAEAEKVTQTTRRLSATLRRLLDIQAHRERKRVAQLLREIRTLAAKAKIPPQDPNIGLEIESIPELTNPFDRGLWETPPPLEQITITDHIPDNQERLDLFQHLAKMERIDWRKMRQQIHEIVTKTGQATLKQLLEQSQTNPGVIEVLGYLQIASDDGHLIRIDTTERITLEANRENQKPITLEVPLVTFLDLEKPGAVPK